MKNYINADFHRIEEKKSRFLLLMLIAVIQIAFLLYSGLAKHKDAFSMTNEIDGVDTLYMVIIMAYNILLSYGQDFQAKAMQSALGMGLTRRQVVLSKWISMSLIIVADFLFLGVVQFTTVIALGKLAGGFTLSRTITTLFSRLIMLILSMTLTMIVLFYTQNVLLGILAYFYIILGVTSSIIDIAIKNPIVQKLQLWNIDVTNQVPGFMDRLLTGQFDIRYFLGILLYFIIGIELSVYLFKKKELDF